MTRQEFEEIFNKVEGTHEEITKKDSKKFSNGTTKEVQAFLETLKDDSVKNELVNRLSLSSSEYLEDE